MPYFLSLITPHTRELIVTCWYPPIAHTTYHLSGMRAVVLSLTMLAVSAHGIFGDVRDRLGCQLPGHTDYQFCNASLSTKDRVKDLMQRIPDNLKPSLLTARACAAIPEIGVPSYYWVSVAIIRSVYCFFS